MNKNFKYKVGDRVIVREDLHKGHYYNMENSKENNCIAEDMLPLRGDIVTIDRIADYGQYKEIIQIVVFSNSVSFFFLRAAIFGLRP